MEMPSSGVFHRSGERNRSNREHSHGIAHRRMTIDDHSHIATSFRGAESRVPAIIATATPLAHFQCRRKVPRPSGFSLAPFVVTTNLVWRPSTPWAKAVVKTGATSDDTRVPANPKAPAVRGG